MSQFYGGEILKCKMSGYSSNVKAVEVEMAMELTTDDITLLFFLCLILEVHTANAQDRDRD
jgi:hypothetical protein